MSTLLFILAVAVLILVITSRIPGLEHLIKPLIDLLFTALKAILENVALWSIFLFKNLWSSHLELIRHLLFSAESVDPSVAVREKT